MAKINAPGLRQSIKQQFLASRKRWLSAMDAAWYDIAKGVIKHLTEPNDPELFLSSTGDWLPAGGGQPLDEDLTAIAALSTTGLINRTGAGTAATRAIGASSGTDILDRDAGDARYVQGALVSGGGLTGDGSDGDVTLGAGDTTITRDMFYDNLTIPSGSTLLPDGYRVFVRNTLTIDGAILRDGAAGASTANPAIGGATVSASGRPLGGIAGGGDGASGAGTAGTAVSPSAPGYTSSGGAGGAGTNAAGAGGTSTVAAAPGSGGLRMAVWAIMGRASGTSSQITGGPGGGGGGGTFGGGGVGAIGGGGGAGGGYVTVAAGRITGSGSITANGGAGGNGHTDGGGTTAAGGGGGGGGGVLVVFSGNGVFPPTVTANGGAAGTAFSGGGAGNAGPAGQVMLFAGP